MSLGQDRVPPTVLQRGIAALLAALCVIGVTCFVLVWLNALVPPDWIKSHLLGWPLILLFVLTIGCGKVAYDLWTGKQTSSDDDPDLDDTDEMDDEDE